MEPAPPWNFQKEYNLADGDFCPVELGQNANARAKDTVKWHTPNTGDSIQDLLLPALGQKPAKCGLASEGPAPHQSWQDGSSLWTQQGFGSEHTGQADM